jgi:hypothetical protein
LLAGLAYVTRWSGDLWVAVVGDLTFVDLDEAEPVQLVAWNLGLAQIAFVGGGRLGCGGH